VVHGVDHGNNYSILTRFAQVGITIGTTHQLSRVLS
jgi:hypothetical protein